LFNNQAGLAELKNVSILISAQETFRNPYSDNMGSGIAFPIPSGTFGLNVHYFGAAEIRQTKIGLAYARQLTERFSIGRQFDVLTTQIPKVENSNLFTFEIGLQHQLLENLLLGVHYFKVILIESIFIAFPTLFFTNKEITDKKYQSSHPHSYKTNR